MNTAPTVHSSKQSIPHGSTATADGSILRSNVAKENGGFYEGQAAHEAFREAGIDLAALHRQQQEMARRNAGSFKTMTAMAVKTIAACMKCGQPTEESILCDACLGAAQAEQTRREEAARARERDVDPAEVGDDFPDRHVCALSTFAGTAVTKAEALLPKVLAGQILLLYGPPGHGKTGMAVWWEWQRLRRRQRPGAFMTAQDFFSTLKATWAPQSKITEADYLADLRRKPYVVIDEMDERSASDWENRTLFNFINHSYNDLRTLVLISNLTKPELLTAYPEKLLARISEAGGMVHCGGEGWRDFREGEFGGKK